jgi:DNA-binding protein YbaB
MKPEDFGAEKIYELIDKYSPEYSKKLTELKEKLGKHEVVLQDDGGVVTVTVCNKLNAVKDIKFTEVIEHSVKSVELGPLVMDTITRALKILDEELLKMNTEFREWEVEYLKPITQELQDSITSQPENIDIVANSKKLN